MRRLALALLLGLGCVLAGCSSAAKVTVVSAVPSPQATLERIEVFDAGVVR
jgi:hypothetical protein